ncbi:hypothetical protein O6H91_22G004900 [Diphasiastrum complanatum]|uniref:Uncharacterized protein n=1 Tax=Diphasiastrum complanatum TaxID=34168 RepID=A0ACC2ACA2_DIPCM|nr:hypothetical protein O6H91_22G004900 [Diphasiastrum complanatum]
MSSSTTLDESGRELMELKTLVTKTLEKRGVLARIRAELRANVFAAIEEQERDDDGSDGGFALIGKCNEKAKKLHATPTGKMLASLICEYLEWCELEHTMKVYLPECNMTRGLSRSELQEKLALKVEFENGRDAESAPLLLTLLEEFNKIGQRAGGSSTSSTIADSKPNEIPGSRFASSYGYEDMLKRLEISRRDSKRE